MLYRTYHMRMDLHTCLYSTLSGCMHASKQKLEVWQKKGFAFFLKTGRIPTSCLTWMGTVCIVPTLIWDVEDVLQLILLRRGEGRKEGRDGGVEQKQSIYTHMFHPYLQNLAGSYLVSKLPSVTGTVLNSSESPGVLGSWKSLASTSSRSDLVLIRYDNRWFPGFCWGILKDRQMVCIYRMVLK